MKRIILTFANQNHLDLLLGDNQFLTDAGYLKPERLDAKNVIFYDTVPEHDRLASEEVVLTFCARAIRRIAFNNTGDINYNYPYVLELKGGINYNGTTVIVTNTAVELG